MQGGGVFRCRSGLSCLFCNHFYFSPVIYDPLKRANYTATHVQRMGSILYIVYDSVNKQAHVPA